MSVSSILCIDESIAGASLEDALRRMGHRAVRASTLEEAMRAVVREPFDLIISDHHLPDGTGTDLLATLQRQGLEVPVIITSHFQDPEQAVASIRQGAVDVLTKPLRAEAVRFAVTKAIELERLQRVNEDCRHVIRSLRGSQTIVGTSAALISVLETLRRVAPTRATVLLEGESGTGKELLARSLHDLSPRAGERLVTVNCAALPDGLVESTLFGHERGAFTGASMRSIGAFERAHRGTLVLDEISEMRLDLQPKLLRAIQEQEFERVGGRHTIPVDVRIVATTNRDLRAEVEAGRFRRDLYYRVNVVPIRTPPLRERLEDIPQLVGHFVRLTADQIAVKPPPEITPAAIAALQRHSWRGNVRELANAVERAVILFRGAPLTAEAFAFLADGVRGPESPALPVSNGSRAAHDDNGSHGRAPRVDLTGMLEESNLNLHVLECLAIMRALVRTGGHRARTAQILGISERTLRNKLKARAPATWSRD